jgi:hypothetical protein
MKKMIEMELNNYDGFCSDDYYHHCEMFADSGIFSKADGFCRAFKQSLYFNIRECKVSVCKECKEFFNKEGIKKNEKS